MIDSRSLDASIDLFITYFEAGDAVYIEDNWPTDNPMPIPLDRYDVEWVELGFRPWKTWDMECAEEGCTRIADIYSNHCVSHLFPYESMD